MDQLGRRVFRGMADPRRGCSRNTSTSAFSSKQRLWKFCVDECLASAEIFREHLLELPDDLGLELGILVDDDLGLNLGILVEMVQ